MSILSRLADLLFSVSDHYDKPYETRVEKVGYFLIGYAPNVRRNITMRVLNVSVTEWEAMYCDGFNIGESYLCAQVENPHTGEIAEMRVRNRFTGAFTVRFLRGRIGSLIV